MLFIEDGASTSPAQPLEGSEGSHIGAEGDVDARWGSELEKSASIVKESKTISNASSAKKKRKKKVPTWLSSLGASLNASVTGTSSSKPGVPEAPHGDVAPSRGDTDGQDWVPPPIVGGDDSSGVSFGGTKMGSLHAKNPSADCSENGDGEGDGMGAEGDSSDAASTGEFDWELQRRIWEEQERQLRENGIANASVDVEFGTKVVLGIGVELTGRRLKNFVPQDTELPAPCATEVFTNCIDEQEGIVFRLYEHEKRTKYVPLNPQASTTEKYPKLLGELSLNWTSCEPKGKLRFAISVSANENGDIVAKAEERLREGGVGKSSELVVNRTDLCTMAERRELDAAETRRQAAARAAAGDTNENVLALPCPDGNPMLALPAPRRPAGLDSLGDVTVSEKTPIDSRGELGREVDTGVEEQSKPPQDPILGR